MSWQAEGNCVGMPVHLWFSRVPAHVSRARWLCSWCPCQVRCIEDAIANGDRGIRGGLAYSERKKVHPRPLIHRNAA